MLSWIVSASSAPSVDDGTNNKDILIAIVGVVGTLTTAGLTALVASFHREKTPRSTVEAIENEQDIRREKVWTDQIQQLREAVDESNYEKDNQARLYSRLREAVWAKGLNPDTLMGEISP